MGFQALLIREDYHSILRDTLQRYYTDRYGKGVTVGYEPMPGSAQLVMNPRLGMIFKPMPPAQIRKYLYRGYNVRGNLIKNIAAKAFVFVSTHTRKLFTMSERLYISPSGLVKDETMIAYLNRSVRIFDFKEGTTVSIQKESFTSKFFRNQLQFRLVNSCDFIPAIIAYKENWFEERILSGNSLARETDPERYKSGVRETCRNMSRLMDRTFTEKDARAYIDGLTAMSKEQIQLAKEQKQCETCSFAQEYLELLSDYLEDCPAVIPTALSHGDLQAGNIWLEGEKAWIIDWETVAERSTWFDYTTLYFGTRYYGGIKHLISVMNQEGIKEQMLSGRECEWDVRQMIAVFLLEDLVFYLEDMMELPKDGGRDTFDRYMRELQEIDWRRTFIG